jgi:hypothetical protein
MGETMKTEVIKVKKPKMKAAKPHKAKSLIPHRPAAAKGIMAPAVIPNLAPKKKKKGTV